MNGVAAPARGEQHVLVNGIEARLQSIRIRAEYLPELSAERADLLALLTVAVAIVRGHRPAPHGLWCRTCGVHQSNAHCEYPCLPLRAIAGALDGVRIEAQAAGLDLSG